MEYDADLLCFIIGPPKKLEIDLLAGVSTAQDAPTMERSMLQRTTWDERSHCTLISHRE